MEKHGKFWQNMEKFGKTWKILEKHGKMQQWRFLRYHLFKKRRLMLKENLKL